MVYKNSEKLSRPRLAAYSAPQLLRGRGAVFLLCAAFAACASFPKPETFYADRKDNFALMAPGAVIYFDADVGAARSILERLSLGEFGGGEISQFLGMTDSITAALYASGPRRFLAAASGRYPSGRGGVFFSTSKDWVRAKSASGIQYWHSEKSALSVYLGASRAYVSDADPFAAAPGAESPAVLADIKADAVLSGWMDSPGAALDRIIAALGVPLRIPADRLVFGVYRAEADRVSGEVRGSAGAEAAENESYRAVLRLETQSGTQAAALARIFTMAKLASAFIDFSTMESGADLASLAGIFLSNVPEQDGSALILKTEIMGGRDIALLFNTLSLYSN
ncbi:MAG: hypothetical protein LBH35_04020 [Treponema sp.]|jgi:hypothetical protein|nr:hypothetical protein [Treponema sp.]